MTYQQLPVFKELKKPEMAMEAFRQSCASVVFYFQPSLPCWTVVDSNRAKDFSFSFWEVLEPF